MADMASVLHKQDEAVAGGAFALLRPLLATPHADFKVPAASMYCVAELCCRNKKAAHAAIAADLLQHFQVSKPLSHTLCGGSLRSKVHSAALCT